MILDQERSERLQLLRFPLIAGVVFIHAYGSAVTVGGYEIGVVETGFFATAVRNFCSLVVGKVCVSLFFLMSGFLFFYGFNGTTQEFTRKFRSRIHTLLVPYLIWNLTYYILIATVQKLPMTAPYFSGRRGIIASFSLLEHANAFFGITSAPIAYQFWFISDLMVLVLITPILWRIMMKPVLSYVFLSVLFALWISNSWPLPFPSVEAALLFYAGGILAYRKLDFAPVDRHRRLIFALYAVVSVADVLTKQYDWNYQIHKIGILIGVCAAYALSGYVMKMPSVKSKLMMLASSGFFVFAAHEPLLAAVKKLLFRIRPPINDTEVLAQYFLIPILIISTCTVSFYVLRRLAPKFTGMITGGRGR